ncbi:MAG TPA: anthranilate synthase component I, partial [Hyphomicrobium sp.]|nr:anthranilate synthase component I [Hyphomicrobium sp.]
MSALSALPTTEIRPPVDEFARVYDEGKPQVVWTRLIADLETPVSAYLKLADRRPMSFLLESIEGGSARGRYSVIGFAPDLIWKASGDTAEINRSPESNPDAYQRDDRPTLQSLRNLLQESAITLPEFLPPMSAGIFGYMGYDTVRLIETLPEMTPDTLGVPDAILIRPTLMLIFDNVK